MLKLAKADLTKYQKCVITLCDDSIAVFTGPAVFVEGCEMKIKSIDFTLPEALPEGVCYDKIEEKQ